MRLFDFSRSMSKTDNNHTDTMLAEYLSDRQLIAKVAAYNSLVFIRRTSILANF